MRCAIALVLLGGCHVVFGVDPADTGAPSDAADHDAADAVAIDAPDSPACSSSTPYMAELLADTYIVPDAVTCNPSMRFGASLDLHVGGDEDARVLLRFALPVEVLSEIQAGEALGDATLTVTTSAAGSELDLAVHPLTDAWNEGAPAAAYYGAAWCKAIGTDIATQTEWQAPGANGIDDRGATPLETRTLLGVETTAGNVLAISLSGAQIGAARGWISSEKGHLSLILIRASPTGALFLQSREATPSSAQLELRVCD